MKVIGICGKMGSGKNYTANLIKELYSEKVEMIAFADELRIELDNITKDYCNGLSIDALSEKYIISTDEMIALIELIKKDNYFNETYTSYTRTNGVRHILQYWGTDVRRKHDNNYWVDALVNRLTDKTDDNTLFIVTDVRFPNEADSVINELSGILINCIAPTEIRKERINHERKVEVTESELLHPSEVGLDTYENFDFYVNTKTKKHSQSIALAVIDYLNS